MIMDRRVSKAKNNKTLPYQLKMISVSKNGKLVNYSEVEPVEVYTKHLISKTGVLAAVKKIIYLNDDLE